MQRAARVVVEAVGAGVHALEHVWQGWTGYGLTASFLPAAALEARQPKMLPEGDTGTGFNGGRQACAVQKPKTQTRNLLLLLGEVKAAIMQVFQKDTGGCRVHLNINTTCTPCDAHSTFTATIKLQSKKRNMCV